MALFNRFLEAQRRFQRELLAKAGVVGVGIGRKDPDDEELALVALVEQKKASAALTSDDMIPKEVGGIPTDVVEVGIIRAQVNSSPTDHWRPTIPGGVSIAHYLVTAGTYGVMVYDKATGQAMVLSNNHVLANSNDAMLGDVIVQPGPTDGGQNPADAVARLSRYAKLTYTGDAATGNPNPVIGAPDGGNDNTGGDDTPPPTNGDNGAAGCATILMQIAEAVAKMNNPDAKVQLQTSSASSVDSKFDPIERTTIEAQAAIPENVLDAALATPNDPSMFQREIQQIGIITGTSAASLGMRVRKHGRTTGYTEGTVTLINATIDVGYSTVAGRRTARFVGQVMTTGMSQGGDSGSLIVDANSQNAIGLLFAGSGSATIFTPIELVLNRLAVQITPPAQG